MKSFLNYLLPDDEYKRTRILYFLGESAVILALGAFIFAALEIFLFDLGEFDIAITLFIVFGFIGTYTYMRYIFSGIEFTNVYNQKQYKKERKFRFIAAISSGFVFFIVIFLFNGKPSNTEDWFDIIGPSVFFIIFLFLFDYISLKRSYRKNKELTDD
ncbi:hypothetical protein [Oceanobacillus manasiensis]|uniref:hypothetical protein n=1 Tax=Oceanobacillus manasiensis TaxID=586413 RepID=UPI0005A9EF20|nr:hypothetical protein [Oceanobacillus manasiensis]